MSTTATTAAATTANNEPQQVQTFATGAKRGTDHADCDLALIPPEAIRAYGRAFAEGRKKYGTHNWLKGFPQLGVINHALQHIYSYLEGDRSEDHLGHAMWNIGTAIHQEKHRPDLLDLPPYAEVDRRIHGLAEESLTPAEWNSETEVDLSYTNDTSDSTDTFDLITYLKRQIAFSFLTFGPGDRHKGVIDHIRKELVEIENDPTDLEEWIDVVILALDGAWRSGAHPPQITEKLIAKLEKNEKRNWPDWREVGQDKAIEHDRSKDSNHTMQSNKSLHQQSVEAFMINARQSVPVTPTVPTTPERRLRAKLMFEEVVETVNALGFSVVQQPGGEFEFVNDLEFDLIEVIDGCCDVAVVTTGTLSACGVPDLPFQEAINENNLAKFGPGHSWREDGKLVKPPGHKKPDIQAILNSL